MSGVIGLDSLKAETLQLDNGLVAGAAVLPRLHRAVIAAQVRVGPAYERARDNGVSHFLEHMLFRGTPVHPSAYQLASAFEALGGTLEAATAEDYGFLQICVPPESVEAALSTFCDVLTEPLLSEIDVERDIVREEILEGLDDEGRDIDASSRCRRLCFGDHPLGFPITGTLDALESFDRDLLAAHHARHYTGKNLTVMVSGPIDTPLIFDRVSERLGRLEPGSLPKSRAPEPQRETRFGFFKHKSSQTALSLCYRAPGRGSPLEPATEMLLRVLDDGMSTRLYHRICDQLGLCYDAGAGYQAFAESGVVELQAETAHDRALSLLRELLHVTGELAAEGPRVDELERARRRSKWQFQTMLDEPEAVAHFFAHERLEGSERTPAERCEQLCDVSLEQLRESAQHIFHPTQLSVAAMGLQNNKQQAELERLARG